MALLGIQLVITLVVVSVIQKINPHFSLAKWILCSTGLIRYLYPTNDELKTLANIPKEKPRKGKHLQNGNSHQTFHVPRNLDITLENAQVTNLDIIHLKYYSDFQWLLDFSIYATITYVLTEVYYYLYSIEGEINLSMLWCILVIGFSLYPFYSIIFFRHYNQRKILIVLWVQYFKSNENTGERSTCIVMGIVYLLIALAVQIIDEKIIEIGLNKAYTSFNQSATKFLGEHGLSSTGPASGIVLKFSLAVWCGLLGSLLTFPGLRMAQMHSDALIYHKQRKMLSLLANISFASPLLLVCLWIKPISRDYLTVRVFTGASGPLLEKLKKESGRITNVDLQKKIAAVFYYLCVVSIQFIAPLLLCLFFSFMYKTLGGYSWNGFGSALEECSVDESHPVTSSDNVDNIEKTITQTAEEFHLALGSLKQIFTTEVFRGLFGLATWWTCFTIFATNALGMFCQSYLTAA
ncbi:GSCOCG00007396001-RA-CDS [Cotesia congregata]|nr:GSCOCG00007396001-RA-CDS [Cotesia congregata]